MLEICATAIQGAKYHLTNQKQKLLELDFKIHLVPAVSTLHRVYRN